MKLHIFTQVFENYGDSTNPYWKAKGGDDYVVRNIENDSDATVAVMAVREQIESNNDYLRETIVGWNLVADDYLTDFERSQLEYDGAILYPSKEIIWK
jgi:hypothetical protein